MKLTVLMAELDAMSKEEAARALHVAAYLMELTEKKKSAAFYLAYGVAEVRLARLLKEEKKLRKNLAARVEPLT